MGADKEVERSSLEISGAGFSFNPEPVLDEINACKAIVDPVTVARALGIGFYNIDQYNELVAKMKTAGSDKIIAEIQRQLDAWKASK